MKQEEMLEKIRRSAETIQTPPDLEPESMMRKLNGEKRPSGRGKYKRAAYRYGGLAAAVLAVCIVAGMPRKAVVTGTGSQAEAGNDFAAPQTTAAREETGMPETAQLEEAAGPEEQKYQASSYDDIYDVIRKQAQEWECAGGIPLPRMEVLEDGAAPAGIRNDAATAGTGGIPSASAPLKEIVTQEDAGVIQNTAEYSGTNVQVEGVDEGDIVKTDGTYIYVASGGQGTIQIIEPDGAKMKKMGLIPDTSTVSGPKSIEEFYVNGNLLSVIRKDYYQNSTVLETYDLADPEKPELSGSVTQDGYYRASRRSGDYIYLFTEYTADTGAKKREIERYIPKVEGKIIPLDCIYLPEHPEGIGYLVASSVNMKSPDEAVQSKAIYSGGNNFYVSLENIYIGNQSCDYKAEQYDYTELLKFSYTEGKIRFRAHGNVDGYLNDQFSMDEYEGNLRLVTTLSHQSGNSTNSLTILDEKLKKIGRIEDLAPGEQIYSARFMGDTAYFVTFRNMDPLFSADLSNPQDPKILGELKITGFSEYLHPYGDGLLLGIGREVSPATGNFKGLKLSMFDTGDLSDVKETGKMVEPSYEYSPAWSNHKSVVISQSRNLIGFPADVYDSDKREWSSQYVVYSYEKDGFKRRLAYELDTDVNFENARGLFIGDWFYVVEENRITSFDMAHFNKFGQMEF